MPKIVVDFLTTDFTPHYDKIDLERVWDLIDDEVELFVGRTPKSAAIFTEAKESMINGTPNSWWSHPAAIGGPLCSLARIAATWRAGPAR